MTRELRGNGSQDRAPARLREQGRELARLLDQANHDYRQGLDETGAWRRLRARHTEKRRRAVLVPLGAALATAAAVAFWLLPLSRPGDGAVIGSAPPEAVEPLGTLASPASVAPPSRPPVAFGKAELPPARPSRLVPTPAALPLPTGRSILADGSEIELGARARAELHGRAGESTTIALLAGSVELKVAPQHVRTFEVAARSLRFRVLGTRFRVSLEQDQSELEVSEGTVAVLDGDTVVARVTAGQRWSGRAGAAPAGATAAASPPSPPFERPPASAPAVDADQCLAMARQGRAQQAVECLQPLGAGNGLSAEMAMYEIARLQRDVLGDVPAALATLRRCGARFPHGALQTEVRVSEIDLLARSGRAGDALAASAHLLASAGGRERAAELHLLRGNLLREHVGDCDQALREYASAEENPGAVGAEALLGRARCLERQGHAAAAAEAYRACIGRGHSRTTAEARRALAAMRAE